MNAVGATRRCTTCMGYQECIIGDFWTCSHCDVIRKAHKPAADSAPNSGVWYCWGRIDGPNRDVGSLCRPWLYRTRADVENAARNYHTFVVCEVVVPPEAVVVAFDKYKHCISSGHSATVTKRWEIRP